MNFTCEVVKIEKVVLVWMLHWGRNEGVVSGKVMEKDGDASFQVRPFPVMQRR